MVGVVGMGKVAVVVVGWVALEMVGVERRSLAPVVVVAVMGKVAQVVVVGMEMVVLG
jgi:hypothetical protein